MFTASRQGKSLALFFFMIMRSMANGQSTQACTEAGVTSCCQSGSCKVSSIRGDCFCDESCYTTRDCCNDIEFICPPPALSAGSGDTDDDIASGSGALPTTDSTPVERAPSITVFQSNRTILVDTAITTRLFINVTHDSGSPQGLLVWQHNRFIISSRTDPRVNVLSSGGLTIRNVRDSDRGLYTVTVSNRLGAVSANFTVFLKFVVINETQVSVVDNNNNIALRFNCTARGYPNLRFVSWQTASGTNTTGLRTFTAKRVFDVEVVAEAVIEVAPDDCSLVGGYRCVFDNGEPSTAIRSTVLECPTIVPVEVSFEYPSYTFSEDSGLVEICVVADFGSSTNPVKLVVSALSSSAVAGVDYILKNAAVRLRPGAARSCVGIQIVEDLLVETTERFELKLVSLDSNLVSVLGSNSVVFINDNDFIQLTFEEAVYEVSESIADSHLALLVCIVRNTSLEIQIPDNMVNITIATEEGTANGDIDFVSKQTNLSLILDSGSTKVCECIQVLADRLVEMDEEFDVVLSSINSAVIGSRSSVRIKDDDEVTIDLKLTEYIVEEDSARVEVCVVVTGAETSTLSVYVCTEQDTAKDYEDYRGLRAHRLVFAPAALSSHSREQCVTIAIVDDTLVERKERFFVTLQKDPRMPGGMRIGQNSTASVTIRDNDAPAAIFINNTPRVQGNSIVINFIIQQRHFTFTQITCILQGPGQIPSIIRNCSSGVLAFSQLPYRFQEYKITIEGVQENGSKILLNERSVRLDSEVCSLHLVNEGVSVSGSNMTAEWQATGPAAFSKARHFTCWRDKIRTGFPCSSPFTMNGMRPGEHRLTVQPAVTTGCRRHISRSIQFTV